MDCEENEDIENLSKFFDGEFKKLFYNLSLDSGNNKSDNIDLENNNNIINKEINPIKYNIFLILLSII